MTEKKKESYQYFRPKEEQILKRRQPGHLKLGQLPVDGGTYVFEGGEFKLVKAPKKPPEPLQIRPGTYKSAGGQKIKVLILNQKSEDFPVIGVIDVNGVWEPRVWNFEGVTKRPFGAVNDIVAAWTES